MAKDWRIIKFTYNLVEYTLDVNTENEAINRRDLFNDIEMIDGTIKRQITGKNYSWDYTFAKVTTDVLDFFKDAYDYNRDGGTVLFDVENDDGTFTQYTNILILEPQWNDDNITTDTGQKVYNNLRIGITGK